MRKFGAETVAGPLRRVNAAGDPSLASSTRFDLSKIEAEARLNPEPVNLHRLIDEVIGTRALAEKNQNRLIVEAQETRGRAHADPMRLKQVCSILSNACKFRGGEVACGCASGGRTRRVELRCR